MEDLIRQLLSECGNNHTHFDMLGKYNNKPIWLRVVFGEGVELLSDDWFKNREQLSKFTDSIDSYNKESGAPIKYQGNGYGDGVMIYLGTLD